MSNMGFTRDHEVVFVRGTGCELFDRDGHSYLDATASLWYCNVGHGRESIADAIRDQAARLAACSCFDVYASDRTLELADRLAEMAPVDDPRIFFTSGGSDSIETAAKVARRFWAELGTPEKTVVISREGAYHGLHAYGTSLTGIPSNRDGFGELVPDSALVPAMDPDSLRERIDGLEGRAAAFVAEPVLGAGGIYPPDPDYLHDVARICADRDVLLIIDEVITGFGRTGRLFACERYGVRPDILVLAKGLTSGYLPLGAVVFAGRVAEPFWQPEADVWLRHGYTYSGHATACAAALANLDILEQEALVERVAALEEPFAATMQSLAELPEVSEVRTIGLLAGVQLSPDMCSTLPGVADGVVERCRARSVLTRRLAGDALQVSPPFVIEDNELERVSSAIRAAIVDVSRNGRPERVARAQSSGTRTRVRRHNPNRLQP